MLTKQAKIGAIVLAAGRSQRMGRSKQTLPWVDGTVIGSVVKTLDAAGVDEIVVVTGADREAVEGALLDLPVRAAHNPRYAEDSMMLSLQAGVRSFSGEISAFLVTLGDQPQIDRRIVRQVIERYRSAGAALVAPSFERRRGHPWLVGRTLWTDLLQRSASCTAREFLNDHAGEIDYVDVDSDSILRDLDTIEEYKRELSLARSRHAD